MVSLSPSQTRRRTDRPGLRFDGHPHEEHVSIFHRPVFWQLWLGRIRGLNIISGEETMKLAARFPFGFLSHFLLVNGLLIFGAESTSFSIPAGAVVLFHLHASVWWADSGAAGAGYCILRAGKRRV